MSDEFFITFQGSHDRARQMVSFFSWLRDIKRTKGDDSGSVGDCEQFIRSSEWIPFIDEQTIGLLGHEGVWNPEDLIDCILKGEYQLVALELSDDQSGVLRYDPDAFPFGGTDPIKGFIELYGYRITRDSFWDGYLEWKDKNA